MPGDTEPTHVSPNHGCSGFACCKCSIIVAKIVNRGMMNFCTLFDSNYLSRGLALYESLYKHCKDFHIFLFPFDHKCYKILRQLDLEKATIISLQEFEDEELLAAKPTRSRVEYCWTCTPTIILYALEKYSLESCTYLDADLYFFDSPKVLLDEIHNSCVIITEHRYTPRYDRTQKSGKYCVQFITFTNNRPAKKVLNWWRNVCNAWCYDRHEDGKFGDQKYLDDWLERFAGVHALQHLGGGVAPWNVQQYDIFKKEEKLWGRVKNSRIEFELIFYHFHHLYFYGNGQIGLGRYKMSEDVRQLIYKPYVRDLEKIKTKISEIDKSIDVHGENELALKNWKTLLRYIKYKLISNIVNKSKLIES